MPLIDTLEKKLGHLAIPHSVRILALFQLVTWVMIKMQPQFADWISLSRDKVLHGEVWRLVTWAFDPGDISVILILFAIMIMFTMGDGLEAAWGTFRVNLYLLGGIAALDIGTMIFGFHPQGLTLSSTILFAFAVFFPNFEFLLFLILPFKAKYLAWLNGALLLLLFIGSSAARLPIIFSMLNFFIAFGPGFIRGTKHGAVVAQRRSRFDAARTAESAAFHKCHACGKTEQDDHTLDFRVTADGEEYCTVCRPRK